MLNRNKFAALTAAILALGVVALAGGGAKKPAVTTNAYLSTEYDYHLVEPLGVECLKLEPSEKLVNLMVSATSPSLEGLRRVPAGREPKLLSEDGKPVRNFPANVAFRISASVGGDPLDPDPLPTNTKLKPEEYILHLRFRVRIFHHLDSWIVGPQSAEMIGMPADVPYNERIYLVKFNLKNLPVEDRITLEVLDDSGQRVTHFHLELL